MHLSPLDRNAQEKLLAMTMTTMALKGTGVGFISFMPISTALDLFDQREAKIDAQT